VLIIIKVIINRKGQFEIVNKDRKVVLKSLSALWIIFAVVALTMGQSGWISG
tara:strand:- start:751 stop:906 length:156 start_codon:yes stop_codon:yes gene_type:complete